MNRRLYFVILLVGLLFINTSAALANETAGRQVTQADWVHHLPEFVVSVLIVIIIDIIFLIPVIRKLRASRS